MKTFSQHRKGHGTQEWSDKTVNFQIGCQHGCVYCYAKRMNHRFAHSDLLPKIVSWTQPVANSMNIEKGWRNTEKVIMFPSSHDIVPENVDTYLVILEKMLHAGISVLCVSKPHLECITAICECARSYKELLLFRFTISSMDSAILRILEPYAPDAQERLACLKYAYEHGFNTSVSSEPLLGGLDTATQIIHACSPFLTHDLWIGKLNDVPFFQTPDLQPILQPIVDAQQDDNILRMYHALQSYPFIAWKDSIKDVIQRFKEQQQEQG